MPNTISSYQKTGHIMGIALFLFSLLFYLQVKAQNYIVGMTVYDTLCVEIYSAFCSNDFLAMTLDSTLIPYVTGLDFQVEITAVNGFVSSNVSDTVKAGDVFPLPAPSESGSLVIILSNKDNSFGFLVKIVGTPLVAGENYYCNPTCKQTLMACQNLLTILAEPSRDSICTVQSRSSIDDIGKLPVQYELKQNYPNPFNPETTIEYTLPKPSFVKLEIYDMLGQEVRTLVNEFQHSGVKSVVWDGKNNQGQLVPSGLYVYRIVADGFKQSSKSLLLK